MRIAVIGGGASGMAAAITAARCPEAEVTLFERQARVGRKLQATGNGRCNLSNQNLNIEHYHGTNPEFVNPALSHNGVDDILAWFRELGLFTVSEDSGKIYPYSNQANSVVDILRFALDKYHVSARTGVEITKLKREDTLFSLQVENEKMYFDRVVIACGGIAGSKLGGTMLGYQLLRSMGHHCTKLRPNLVQIKSNWKALPSLKGIRTNCHVQILQDGQVYSHSIGELQFTEYGLSGPVIFESSRDVCLNGGNWEARLDFLPTYSEEFIYAELRRRIENGIASEEILTGILHNRLGRVLLKEAGGEDNHFLPDETVRELCHCLKSLTVSLQEPLGMDSAQVTSGGIFTNEFDPETMESLLIPGLYACGEVLDIDGDCGGYNLHWAWSSGILAGENAGRCQH